MDTAPHVLDRLERIEALRDGGGSPRELLAELRTLLHEGEAWTAAEPSSTERAASPSSRAARRRRPGEDRPASGEVSARK